MARLVTKFGYMKSGTKKKSGGYARYIATREGVEKIDDSRKNNPATEKQKQLVQKLLKDFPDSKDTHEYKDYMKNQTIGNASEFISRVIEDNNSEIAGIEGYAKYIALRPRAERVGSHGLFTDDGMEVNLQQVTEEMNRHKGNIWTIIISLHREDAERLGFNTGERWRTMLRTQTANLSENFKIPMKNLRWYAAFHNESYHPHVHMMVYSANENEGYLSKQGIENLRSAFAKDIFMQDLYCIYEKQTEYRDKIRGDGKKIIEDIVSEINADSMTNPQIQMLLIQLAERLSRTTGKKVYGYLKPEVKSIVDMILTELSKDERIQKLYDLWYQQKENALKTYTEAMPQRIPLASNNEFKPLKNAIIQEALKISKNKYDGAENDTTEESEDDIPLPMPPEYDVPTPPPEYFEEMYGGEDFVPQFDEEVPIPPPEYFEELYGGEDFVPPISDEEISLLPPSQNYYSQKKTWWTEEYRQARIYLYGDKEHEPDFEKAMELLKSESEKGNGFAMYDWGKMYLSGLGCEKDKSKAQEQFQKAYQAFIEELPNLKNPAYLQYRIGKLYSLGHGVEQDYSKAAEWFEKSVQDKNPFAAYALAGLYSRGQGVEKNDEKAFELYMIAAGDSKKPNAYAQYELGKMYRDGIGTAVDEEKSKDWFKKSYQEFLKIEKDMADDKLYYRLGQMNLTGTGTAIDLMKAKEYFEKAAKLGNDNAMFGLGKLYMNPQFSEYSIEKAIEYLTDASEKGNSFAQYLLGRLYAKGENVPKDIPKAVTFLEKCSANGNYFAAYYLGKIYLNESGFQDINKALYCLKISAQNGNSNAEYVLGKMYLYGNGIEKDFKTAVDYLKSSAAHGNIYAEQLLENINSNRNHCAAVGTLRLLQYLGRMIQNRIDENKIVADSRVDRKLYKKIQDKKQAQGLKQ